MTLLNRICDSTERILEFVVGILCIIIILSLFIEVANRYIFTISWPFLQFLIPFSFIWMCMAGAALAVRRRQHFEVDLLSHILQGKIRGFHKAMMSIAVVLGGLVIAWSSVGFFQLGLLKTNSAIGISMVYIYSSLLVGGLLIALLALNELLSGNHEKDSAVELALNEHKDVKLEVHDRGDE